MSVFLENRNRFREEEEDFEQVEDFDDEAGEDEIEEVEVDDETEETDEEGLGSKRYIPIINTLNSLYKTILEAEGEVHALQETSRNSEIDLYVLLDMFPEEYVEVLDNLNDLESSLYEVRQSIISILTKIKDI